MGLIIKPNPTESSTSMVVFDCTGAFAQDNQGGYGGTNYSVSRIQESLLEVNGPSDGDNYHEFDVTGMLPNTEGLGYEILPSMLGQSGDIIESGKYRVRLTHTILKADETTTTVVGYGVAVFTNGIMCCIDKLELDPGKNAFENPDQKKILELKNLAYSLEKTIDCGFYDKANTDIDYLKAQCICQEC